MSSRKHITHSFNTNSVFGSFDAPNYLTTFIIPAVVLAIIGYIIGLPLVIKHVKAGGYLITKYDKKCESDGRIACAAASSQSEDNPAYNQCVAAYLEANCDSTQERSGKWVPILLYVFLPLLIGSSIAFAIYKLIIFVRNPRIAAGYFLFRGLTNK